MDKSEFLEQFGTREKHNEGLTVQLTKDTAFVIYGPDSDIGREIKVAKYRLDPASPTLAADLRKLYARLVKEWPIKDKVTVEAVDEVFTQAPWVYDAVISKFSERPDFTKG